MAIIDLIPGAACACPGTPLRVTLTGVDTSSGVVLAPVDTPDADRRLQRVSQVELVVLPRSGRLVLEVRSSDGGPLPAGANVGLSVRPERDEAAAWQALVASTDVGALVTHPLAELTFAEGKGRLTALAGPRPGASAVPTPVASAERRPAHRDEPGPVSSVGATAEDSWQAPGLYAFREAVRETAAGPPPTSWGLVLDGSISMRRLDAGGTLDRLIELVSAVMLQWVKSYPAHCAVAGVTTTDVPSAAWQPSELARHAFVGQEPSSWSSLAGTCARVLRSLPAHGALVLVTDGVPGDVDEIARLAAQESGTRFFVVTAGTSSCGVEADQPVGWWQEELAGAAPLLGLPNVTIVALPVRTAGNGAWSVDLTGARPAQLAARMVGAVAPVSR